MEIIDTHCHLDASEFSHDYQDVLKKARQVGVIAQILPGVCQLHWKRLLSLCESELDLFAAIGMHPLYTRYHTVDDFLKLQDAVSQHSPIAIGEIGLDFYVKDHNKNEQKELFGAQIDIAKKNKLPLILHVRKAHDEVLSILRKKQFNYGGIVHAFNGSLQQAKHYLDKGFLLGFGGTLTYPRAHKIRNIAQKLPLLSMVLETDAPDLAPSAYHGLRNSPEYLPDIVNTLSHLRNATPEKIAETTTHNAIELFQLTNLKRPK